MEKYSYFIKSERGVWFHMKSANRRAATKQEEEEELKPKTSCVKSDGTPR